MKSKFYSFALIAITVLGFVNLNFAQWTQRTDMPTARSFAASCELDGKIYVIGGGTSVSSSMGIMEVYDPVTDTWDITKTPIPTARAELCLVPVMDKIYAIGGATSHNGSPLGMVEVYDPLTDTWETDKEPMPTPRKGAAVGVIDNKIYVAGGSAYSNFSPSNKLEIYDPMADTWDVTKENMPSAKYAPCGTILNGLFYVIGGLIGSPWTGQKTVQIYDLSTDTWSYGPDLHYGRVGHTVNSFNGKIYVIGGESQFIPVVSMEVYDPQINSWEVSDIPDVMNIHCSSLFGTDLYIFGGTKCGITSLCPTDDVYSYQLSGWTLQPSGTSEKLNGVYFIYEKGTAVGTGGTILHTTDGGITWENQSSGTMIELSDVCFTNADTGTVVGMEGTILRTTDGGASWESQSSGTTEWLFSVCFTDVNTGTAVGGWESGTILHTTNGGETWISQLSNSYALRDVFFTDVNTGTAVGSNGTILRTTDGGASWESQSSGTTEWLSSVCFTNADTGTVVGGLVGAGGTTVILRTVDGGATWSIQSAAVTCDLADVHFINGNQGTIVGGLGMGGDYHGEIFHTSDGGLTWEKQIGNYPSGFCSVIFTDAMTGTIVGANGTILHTTNGGGGITWVEENPQIDVQIPKRFNLQQNYPNPFNPSTKIRYSIPHLSNVVIKVFDILGNEIETLVNEEKPVGTYEVVFNGDNLSSGVYIYQLQAKDFVVTKKMLLLK